MLHVDKSSKETARETREMFSCYFQHHFIFHNVCSFEKYLDGLLSLYPLCDKPSHRSTIGRAKILQRRQSSRSFSPVTRISSCLLRKEKKGKKKRKHVTSVYQDSIFLFPRSGFVVCYSNEVSLPKILQLPLEPPTRRFAYVPLSVVDNARLSGCCFLRPRTILHIAVT